MKIKKEPLLIALIIILGLFLRVYNIGEESFWIDESATVYTTQQKAFEIINDIYSTTRHAPEYFEYGGTPPLYFVLANYWTQAVGLSEVKLRLLSVLFGILSIYIIYLIGKILFDYKVGLVSAFILSINYLHINYSQEARTYSLGVLLALLTVYFLISALKTQKTRHWIAYIVSSALLLYTHYFASLIVIFEYLFLLLFWKSYKESVKKMVISGIGISILYLPWIPALIRQISLSKGNLMGLGENVAYDFMRIFVMYNSWFSPDLETRIALRSIYHSLGDYASSNIFQVTMIGWLTILSVLLITALLGWAFITSILSGERKITSGFKDKNYAFLLLWLAIPLGIPIIVTLLFPSIPLFGFVQYTIFSSPAYYLLASTGILKSKKYGILLGLLMILSIAPLYSYYSNFDKHQWREVANYLDYNREVGDFVVVSKDNHILSLSYYYNDIEGVVGVKNLDEFQSEESNKNTFWLVYSSEKYGEQKREIKKYMDNNYKLANKVEFSGVKIFRYYKK